MGVCLNSVQKHNPKSVQCNDWNPTSEQIPDLSNMKLFWFTWKKEKLSHNFLHRLLFTIYECRKIVISHKTITCSSVFWKIPNPLSLSTWIPHLNSTKAWHQLIKFLFFPHFCQCCVHLWHTTAFIRAALLYTVEVITVKCKLFVVLFQKASSVCCYCTDLDNNAHIYNTRTLFQCFPPPSGSSADKRPIQSQVLSTVS